MKARIIKCASLPENITPLAESVMLTYCKEGDSALFPYDRDAQYASIADKLHIKWTALYKNLAMVMEVVEQTFYQEYHLVIMQPIKNRLNKAVLSIEVIWFLRLRMQIR